MNDRNRTLLQWVLGAGLAVASVKVIYDFTRPAPTFVEAEKPAASASASASETAGVKLALPKGPRPAGSQPAQASSAPPPNGSAMPVTSGSASPQDAAQMATTLAAIAADPKGNQPLQAQRDPQTGLIILVYQVPGTNESVLALVPGQPQAWAWQLSTDVPPAVLAGAGSKLEKGPVTKQPGATASKIVGGPLDGAVLVTVSDRPDLRIVKSAAFQTLEAQAQAAGPGPGGAGGGGGAPGNPRRHP